MLGRQRSPLFVWLCRVVWVTRGDGRRVLLHEAAQDRGQSFNRLRKPVRRDFGVRREREKSTERRGGHADRLGDLLDVLFVEDGHVPSVDPAHDGDTLWKARSKPEKRST